MKKLIVLLMALVFLLAACGGAPSSTVKYSPPVEMEDCDADDLLEGDEDCDGIDKETKKSTAKPTTKTKTKVKTSAQKTTKVKATTKVKKPSVKKTSIKKKK